VKKKIVLITSGQPSVNPRIVKEADAFYSAGFDVTLLYCYFISWAQEKDIQLLKNVGWNYKLVGGCPTNNKFQYNFSRVRFKIAKTLNKYFGNTYGIAERAQARAYDELLDEAKKIKADWYIGHNLGAIAVAVKAASFNNAKSGFDFEDYHRAEVDSMDKVSLNRIIFLENKYVPPLNYFSAASDMILEAVKSDHSKFTNNSLVLYNCFPLQQLPIDNVTQINNPETLNLFWFSQTIGLNRGLEIVIEALEILKDKNIHLTLAGRCDDDFKKYLNSSNTTVKDNIHFAGIIAPNDLPMFSANFDIGLAVELSNPLNRDICLTNKIFTYLLAGNAIIFSDTKAQQKFNISNDAGLIFSQNNVSDLVNCILYFKNKTFLQIQKSKNLKLAETKFNWQNESKKILEIVN
jgi:glycosyltransferase involved in cell wall biosynthesis